MKHVTDPLKSIPDKLLGKEFGLSGLQVVKKAIEQAVPKNRAEIARRVCRQLNWKNPGGQYQFMSARVALLQLHRNRLIKLPAPTCGNGNKKKFIADKSLLLAEKKVVLPVHKLNGLELERVQSLDQSALYNLFMDHYHYLGFTPMAGAQVRYLIRWEQGFLGAMGFGACAWKLAPRDQWIGWTPKEREQGLHLIINNSRFLILPYVRSQNLASKILAMASRRIPKDFHELYGYAPVLMETFVQQNRFSGHCYQVANWKNLGQTTGRGKKHRHGDPIGSIKDIWVYPLHRKYRKILCCGHSNG